MHERSARLASYGVPWTALGHRLAPWLDPAIGIVAGVLAVVSLLGSEPEQIDPRLEDPNALAVVCTAAAGLALAWRLSRPATSFWVFTAGITIVSVSGHYVGLLSVLLLFALYSLAAHGRRRDALIGLGLCLVVIVALAAADVPDLGGGDVLQTVALLVTAWAVGDAIRSRRLQQAELVQVAEQKAALAREQAKLAVVEERLRIARELHDVVAHSMALIAVQAGVGAHVIRTDADAAEQTLEVIADASRRALDQTRSMLGLLRDETVTTPMPGHSVADLPELLDWVRAAGIETTLDVVGPPRALAPSTELTVYRIVQESLTNVVKHSTGAVARITVTYGPEDVAVEVEDRGGPREARPDGTPPLVPSGHGLRGLRERVELAGGTVQFGPVGGGFRVAASLPSAPDGAAS